MTSRPPRNPVAWFVFALLLAGVAPAYAQAPAHADSVDVPVPLTFDGTGTSAWGPVTDEVDSTASFRPESPGWSLWEYPVGGLWWLIKLPFALLETGFRALVTWWGDVPFFNTIAEWLSRLPDYGVKLRAEWTPASGFRYGVNVYEHRALDGNMHLQYWHVGGGRGDLVNMGSTRFFLGDQTQFDLVAAYHRRGAERFFGIGPDSERDAESFFTGRYVWFGGSLQHYLPRNFGVVAKSFYSDVSSAGPRQASRFDSIEDVFAGQLPRGYGDTSTGMSYEFELRHDTTGTPGRGVNGGLRRAMLGYFHPTSGTGVDFMHYRVVLEQFIGGQQPSGRQLALKGFWSWQDTGNGAVHFQRLLANHDADAFRGYHDFRYRDRGIAGLTVEYRYPVWDYGQLRNGLGMDGYVFWDTGQVFSDHSLLKVKDLTHSLGLGIRMVSTDDFLLRAEIAGSREDLMARLSVSQIFQRQKGGVYHGIVPVPMR